MGRNGNLKVSGRTEWLFGLNQSCFFFVKPAVFEFLIDPSQGLTCDLGHDHSLLQQTGQASVTHHRAVGYREEPKMTVPVGTSVWMVVPFLGMGNMERFRLEGEECEL